MPVADVHAKTYVLVRDTPLTDFVLAPVRHDPHYVILSHHRVHGLGAKIKRFLRASCGPLFRGKWTRSIFGVEYTRRLHEIGPDDKVILFDIRNLKDILLLREELPTQSLHSFLWDPMNVICRGSETAEQRYRREMERHGVHVSTFDPDDAGALGFKYVGGVYRDISELKNRPIETDFWYIGTEKYREGPLEVLASEIEAAGMSYNFMIVPHRHKSRLGNFTYLSQCASSPVPYEQALEHAAGARCLVDLVQRAQAGVTLRAMEAIFLGKKLITNNAAIKREAYYNHSNVYILDDPEEHRTLQEFMDTPAVPISPSILAAHTIDHQLQSL